MSPVRPPPPSTAVAPAPHTPRPGPRSLLRRRSVQVAVVGWVVAHVVVLGTADPSLPFDWPALAGRSVAGRLVDADLALLETLVLIGLVVVLTRGRAAPDLAARAPQRAVALRETLLLLGYGAGCLVGGFLLARAFGWHPFGLHLAGTLYGSHEHVAPAEAVVWAAYNLLVYAVVPLVCFRRRYSAEALNLRSADRRGDRRLIAVVLVLETLFQLLVLDPELAGLDAGQLVVGAGLTFVLYLAGAVLPAMVFIQAILVPRLLRLTGSVTTTVLLGGLTYVLLHVWDAWTVFTSPRDAVLSVVFLLFTYLGPGMVKTVLTVRTGNAWVHVWAYHALAPHTLFETRHVVEVFSLR